MFLYIRSMAYRILAETIETLETGESGDRKRRGGGMGTMKK